MAPARMMQFVDKHVKECDICRFDPDLQHEIEKIREFVVPESKIPKAVRVQQEAPAMEISPEEDREVTDDTPADTSKITNPDKTA